MLTNESSVFLTGSTGCIGGELMRALLNCPVRELWALVRPQPQHDATQRVRARLTRSDCKLSDRGDALHVVPGDLAQPGLGIGASQMARIARNVDLIIHCASNTSFIDPHGCYRTNVRGMQHLIEFVRLCKRQPLVVYVSTATSRGVVCDRCVDEDEAANPEIRHFNEYTRSKAQAERLLLASGLHALVVRPSIVLSAGIRDRRCAMNILWCAPLFAMLEAAPIDRASRLDVVTVGFVVDCVIRLLRHHGPRFSCYHLSAGPAGATRCGTIFDYIDSYYMRSHRLQLIPPTQWNDAARHRFTRSRVQRIILVRVRPYLPFLNMNTVFDCRRISDVLGQDMPDNPPVTAYLGELLQQFSISEALAASLAP